MKFPIGLLEPIFVGLIPTIVDEAQEGITAEHEMKRRVFYMLLAQGGTEAEELAKKSHSKIDDAFIAKLKADGKADMEAKGFAGLWDMADGYVNFTQV